MTSSAAPTPQQLADDAVRAVLQTQWDGNPAVRLDSPPGAGKTGVVERLAVQSLGLLRERCMIATQTNEQSFDLARRLAEGYPRQRFNLHTKKGLALPPDLLQFPNLSVLDDAGTLPAGPCVVIANAAKWSWLPGQVGAFDLQLVDEAFQLPDYRFQQIAGLARRFVLIGDPGQIAPVIACEIERWKSDPSGPHVACPRALSQRHPTVPRLTLPVSRRLVQDTVRLVQPAFYPDLAFRALSSNGDRRLILRAAGTTPADRALNLAASGASIVLAELPERITGELDEEAAEFTVGMIQRLISRGATVRDDGQQLDVRGRNVGVVCAHVSQVNAVRERLPATLSDVLVETADRFQGLQRELMFVHHPLSGRTDASEFHLDAGRLCVMLSRHRVACWVIARSGIERQLRRYAPSGDRVLGVDLDAEYEGWRAQTYLLDVLRCEGRIVPIA
jgi:hypothetical protein